MDNFGIYETVLQIIASDTLRNILLLFIVIAVAQVGDAVVRTLRQIADEELDRLGIERPLTADEYKAKKYKIDSLVSVEVLETPT
jgi:hypothetical protein